jgi:hypothetical protein
LKGGVGGEFLLTPGKRDKSGEVMGLDAVAAGSMMARLLREELETTVQDGLETANQSRECGAGRRAGRAGAGAYCGL